MNTKLSFLSIALLFVLSMGVSAQPNQPPKPFKATSYAMLVLAGNDSTITAAKFEGYPDKKACDDAIGEIDAQRSQIERVRPYTHPSYEVLCVPMYTPPMNYAGYGDVK